jgi:cobalt-zinc-cadmium efflux system membrane fusion protein
MRTAALLLVVTMFSSAGCKEVPHEERAAEKGGRVPGEQATAHEGETENLLRIAPEMLRDLRITTAPAEARVSGEGVTALGELRVNDDAYAEVGTPVAARVLTVLVGVGDVVQAGQPLVELRSVELGKARAEYLRAQARAQLTSRVLQRKRGLAAERIVPQRELQEAEAEALAAAAELAAAAAGLKALGVGENDVREGDAASAELVLRAPIAGTVIDRTVVRGQMADPASPLLRVADLSRLWLIAHAFERDAVRIQVGAAARASFPALPGQTFAGTVAMVGKQVDVSSRTVPVRIEIANDGDVLRPGMSATARLPLGDAGGSIVAVPTAALQHRADGWCVFIPRADGSFEIRPVGRGRDLGGEVEVVNGLQAGETVVVDGAFLLRAEAERARGAGEHHDH